MIPRQPVVSSNLRSVGYDPPSVVLAVEFNHGGVYHYQGVPSGLHAGLMAADSHGKFFNAYIKDVYPYQKVG